MRVIVPYTETHPISLSALSDLCPDAEHFDVSESDTAYAKLLERLWGEYRTFLVIEHDIEIKVEALQEAQSCLCEWSVSPYRGIMGSLVDNALGCTRFRSSLMKRFPDAIARANQIDDNGSICGPGNWKRLDGRVLHILRTLGAEPHRHSEVLHHHKYAEGCACGGYH